MIKNVSAVIPNYNGRHLLAKHLPSVIAALRTGDELVIVDDCSTDDSVKWLRDFFDLESEQKQNDFSIWQNEYTQKQKKIHVVLVKNAHNLRFGASCNRGVQTAQSSYVFLLNSDVSPHKDVLEKLLPHFDNPKTFAVGCLEQEDHDGQIISGGKNTLRFERGMFFHSRATNFETGPTAWVSGGSGMFDRQKWLEVGGFDLRYAPAYWEDTDLSFQARKKDWKVLFESTAVVDHNHESTNTDAFGKRRIAEMSWRNAKKFLWKNGTVWQKIAHILWQPYWLVKWQRWIRKEIES